MNEYDVIVIGSGAGLNVGSNCHQAGMRVALLEHGVMGGTCLNNGCIPTKILLYPADVVRMLEDARAIGVEGEITRIDFGLMMKRMRDFIVPDRQQMERSIEAVEGMDWYKETGTFVSDHTMQVGKERVTAPKIIIASGSRPYIPPAEGLDKVGYLNNVSVLDLKAPPKSLVIIGGGYVACEYGHFFSALGTDVTIIGRNPRLLKDEEPEVSELVKKRFSKVARIFTNYEVVKAEGKAGNKVVHAKDRSTGKVYAFQAEEIMVAAGRRSNADLLKFESTGVETDPDGWVKVNEYLETTKEGIWALGDALGYYMFRHTANYEAEIVWNNAFLEKKKVVDYHAVPHAVFGYPQVAGVGFTQAQAEQAGMEILVGKARYSDVTKGYAMGEDDTLVKVIVDAETRRILGASMVGPEAAEMVQQLVYLMNAGKHTYMPIVRSQIIHPALSEVVVNAFANLSPVGGQAQHHDQEEGHDHHGHEHAHGKKKKSVGRHAKDHGYEHKEHGHEKGPQQH